jgi:hypothetical protein
LKSASHFTAWFWFRGFGVVGTLLVLAPVHGCGQTVEVGLDDALSTGGTAAAGGGSAGFGGLLELGGAANAGSTSEAGAPACVVTACRGKIYECGDCKDNADADGLIDALDPDCFGPCDNDELGLGTGLKTAQGAACKQDCYFDGDAGPGNDKCEWNHSCDPLSVAPDYPPSGEARCKFNTAGNPMCDTLMGSQPTTCLGVCLPLVPNGCDCFGCCELPRDSGQFHFMGAGGPGEQGCQRAKLDDPIACPPCTQVKSCLNRCDACETCVGGIATDPSCQADAACPVGRKACGPDFPCEDSDYCVTGCCVPPPK